MKDPLFIVVDLFCGAGGVTQGFVLAQLEGMGIAKVVACVNHDPKAIQSHWRNHPEVKHFEEDIRTLDLTDLEKIVAFQRRKHPSALVILWASLECTNFSRAKGGQPRDADSRTLADHLDRYIISLNPDYVQIENVVEFKDWGPMVPKVTKVDGYEACSLILDRVNNIAKAWEIPDPDRKGEYWKHWCKRLCGYGFRDDWKELNSANFGAYTSRNRLFGIFAKDGLPIIWPSATHARVSKNSAQPDLFGPSLRPWKAVKEVLDFADEGQSIFNRKKPLSDKTLERILAGLFKYVAKGNSAFISKYFSGKPKGKVNSVEAPASTVTAFGNQSLIQAKNFSDLSINEPAGALTTIDHHALVQTAFIQQRNSGEPESKLVDINGPARTLTGTGGNQDLVQLKFLLQTYAANSKGLNVFSIENPGRTLTTRDSTNLISANFLSCYYGNGDNVSSIESPSPTLVTKDRIALVQPVPFLMPTNFDNQPRSIEEPAPVITANRKHHYIVNPSHGGHTTSTDQPCPVIIARQDKAPLYLVQALEGAFNIPVYDTDSAVMIEIKKFMAVFHIVDIKMRMLRVHELLKIQGFPVNYKLEGNQGDKKKFIGNSVVPQVVKAWIEALGNGVLPIVQQKRVA